MYRVFVLLAIVATACGRTAIPRIPMLDGRIVGGESTDITNYPFQVSVRWLGSHICGGSILSKRIVVSAGHCWMTSSWNSVQYGQTNIGGSTNVINAVSFTRHPQYDANEIDYDIAVLELASDIPLGTGAQPIVMAVTAPAPGTVAYVSGWGTTSEGGSASNVLQAVAVEIVSQDQCNKEYDPNIITDRMICAGVVGGGKDACQGDSGGPLIANDELVGIVSWGFGCARPEYSGVYSNVPELRSWVLDNWVL